MKWSRKKIEPAGTLDLSYYVEQNKLLKERVEVLSSITAAQEAIIASKERMLDTQRTMLNDQRNIILNQKYTLERLVEQRDAAWKVAREAEQK